METQLEQKMVAILNKHDIGAGSFAGRIIGAMVDAYEMGVKDAGSWEGAFQTESPPSLIFDLDDPLPVACPKCGSSDLPF